MTCLCSVLNSVNYPEVRLSAGSVGFVFGSVPCSLSQDVACLRPCCSLNLHINSVVITRKLTMCFFTENHSAPPDVTTYTSEHSVQVERPQGSTTSRTAPKYGNAELMETGDGRSRSSSLASRARPEFCSPAFLCPGRMCFPRRRVGS